MYSPFCLSTCKRSAAPFLPLTQVCFCPFPSPGSQRSTGHMPMPMRRRRGLDALLCHSDEEVSVFGFSGLAVDWRGSRARHVRIAVSVKRDPVLMFEPPTRSGKVYWKRMKMAGKPTVVRCCLSIWPTLWLHHSRLMPFLLQLCTSGQ